MNYTIGNWTIESLTTDSIETSKNIPVTDLDFPSDYTLAQSSNDEVVLMNTTGASLEPVEYVRFGRSKIQDVYAGTDIPAVSRVSAKQGVRSLTEVRLNLKATNSVSGDEVLLPLKGWVCLQLPTASMITPAAISYLLTRTMAVAFNTGASDAGRVTEIARGDLSPL